MAYELLCASVRGESHVRNDTPREDFGSVYNGSNCKIFVLGDGHGDPNCTRSNIGSELVCQVAIECLSTFANDIYESEWAYKLFDPKEKDEIINKLITSIFYRWTEAVNKQLEEDPLTEEEYQQAQKYSDSYKKGEKLEHVFGTTMIAGLFTEEYLLLIHQGDGRCMLFNSDGSVTQPVPWDERCFANETTSMCDVDAAQRCRHCIIDVQKNPFIACFLGSDGVEDSFPSIDATYTYYRDLLKRASKSSVKELEMYLNDTLPQLSAEGSHDDITISAIIDVSSINNALDRFEVEDRIVVLKTKLDDAKDHLESMISGGRLQYLNNLFCKARDDYNAFIQKNSISVPDNNEISDNTDENDILEKKRRSIEKARSELILYVEKYNQYVETFNETLDEINATGIQSDEIKSMTHFEKYVVE